MFTCLMQSQIGILIQIEKQLGMNFFHILKFISKFRKTDFFWTKGNTGRIQMDFYYCRPNCENIYKKTLMLGPLCKRCYDKSVELGGIYEPAKKIDWTPRTFEDFDFLLKRDWFTSDQGIVDLFDRTPIEIFFQIEDNYDEYSPRIQRFLTPQKDIHKDPKFLKIQKIWNEK